MVRQFPRPDVWSILQHPYKHCKSYNYNQTCQITQMNPFVLRTLLSNDDAMLEKRVYNVIKEEFAPEIERNGWSCSEVIIWVYATYAHLQYCIFQEEMDANDIAEMHRLCTEWIALSRRFAKTFPKAAKEETTAAGAGQSDKPKPNKDDAEGDEERLSMLPNLHGFDHLAYEVTDLYGPPENVVVTPGEQKHGDHKQKAKASNKRAVDKQILLRTETLHRLRFTADGTFEKEAPELIERLRLIVKSIPELMDGITPGAKALDEDKDKMEDFQLKKRQRETARNMEIWPRQAKKGTRIRALFEDALRHDDSIPPIIDSTPEFYIRYFRQFSFDSVKPNRKTKRITLNADKVTTSHCWNFDLTPVFRHIV